MFMGHWGTSRREKKKPGETLENLKSYVKHAKLVFTTVEMTADAKKNSMIQVWGSDDMMLLYEHFGTLKDDAIQNQEWATSDNKLNIPVPMYKLFYEMPQGN